MDSDPIHFDSVTASRSQIDALYALLLARTHSISHRDVPSVEAHADFVRQHPYREWYLVLQAGTCIGSVYLTQENTLGIDLAEGLIGAALAPVLDFVKRSHAPLPALKSVRSAGFCVNVAPGNAELRSALEAYGSSVLQITYALEGAV